MDYSVPLAAAVQDDDVLAEDAYGEAAADAADAPAVIGIPCTVPLPDGCYRFSFTPGPVATGIYRGTIRVDRAEGSLFVSGDLYFYPPVLQQTDEAPQDALSTLPGPVKAIPPILLKYGIPIYPRRRYHSYLKATQVSLKSVKSGGRCFATITFQQYRYTQPAAGQFNGTFPASPGTKTITLRFALTAAPSAQWPGNYYTGTWREGNVSRGAITLGWVSKHFRRATVEIDTVAGAVAPQSVGGESFATMLASAGWLGSIVYDQSQIPKPANVPNAKDCWTDGQLHGLMQSVRKASTDLDKEWRLHVIAVPGKLGCSRGKMYDSIGVPREGVVTYSDDGYPSDSSSFFGAAANKKQRDVPRAFLRSASHEVVHGFNQIHQEQEGGADNSIMTTTPSVADVLATATTGDPGVFPDQIKLTVNKNVRHHMIHFPDPVVRPGGHTFASWASGSGVPSADRFALDADVATLTVAVAGDHVELGEPLDISWELTNTGATALPAPSHVTQESLYARLTVIDAAGQRHTISPFVIDCESTSITAMEPGECRSASTKLFWAGDGFAFERPGRYAVEVSVDWTVEGRPLAAVAETSVFVNYPTSPVDNAAASRLLAPEVGKWVALGGGAPHLTEAVAALNDVQALASSGDAGDAAALGGAGEVKALRGFAGLLPEDG